MSNRPCNKCELSRIKRTYGGDVRVGKDKDGWTTVTQNGRFVASFMRVSEKCKC